MKPLSGTPSSKGDSFVHVLCGCCYCLIVCRGSQPLIRIKRSSQSQVHYDGKITRRYKTKQSQSVRCCCYPFFLEAPPASSRLQGDPINIIKPFTRITFPAARWPHSAQRMVRGRVLLQIHCYLKWFCHSLTIGLFAVRRVL